MKSHNYISLFIILQMLIGFGVVPTILLDALYGDKAVIIYCFTAFCIISALGIWIWFKGRQQKEDEAPRPAEINALGFGLVFAFIMAEVVTVILLTKF